MKKIFVILMGLLFLGSVFSYAVLGCCMTSITASPNKVKVGELITIQCQGGCDPGTLLIEGTGNASFVSYNGATNVFVYRANKTGVILFYNSRCTEVKSNNVNIVPNSYPMFSFMKILGLGKTD